MLKDLIVKEAEVKEEMLEKILHGFVQFTEQGKVLLTAKLRKLPSKKKILIYLAAKKAWSLISDSTISAAGNSELQTALNIQGGSLRPRIKELRDEGLVVTMDAQHSVTDAGIHELLGKEGASDE